MMHGGSGEGGAASPAAPASTLRRTSGARPGRLRVVYSCAALDAVDGEASGLEGALRRLGVSDDACRSSQATAKQAPPFGRAVLPSPGASSSGGSGDSAWDAMSNCSSCGSPRGEPRHRRTGSCPVFGGAATLGGSAAADAACRPPPLWLRRGRGRGPMVDVLDGLPDLGKVEAPPPP
jgi:hypothetical protein